MLEKLNVIILALIVVIAGTFIVKGSSTCPMRSSGEMTNNSPLFIDQRGRVIDPYLQREVKNTITYNAGKIQECYNAFMTRSKNDAEAKTGGVIHLDWMVGATGKAFDARVIFSNFADDGLKSCSVSAINDMHFPAPGQARYAEHRFNFSEKEAVAE